MKTESPFGGVSSPYAVGRIRALEGGLLDRARWNRLIEAPDERQAIRLLREFGYGGGADLSLIHILKMPPFRNYKGNPYPSP